MAHTSWFFLAYGAALFTLFLWPEKVAHPVGLRRAWRWFAYAVVVEAFFTLIRAANHNELSIGLVEIWAAGISWACVAMSLLRLPAVFQTPTAGAALARRARKNEPEDPEGFDELEELDKL